MKEAKVAARLERSSFLRNEVERKKREWKAEIAAIKIKKIRLCQWSAQNQTHKKRTSEPKSRRSQQTNSMKTVIFYS